MHGTWYTLCLPTDECQHKTRSQGRGVSISGHLCTCKCINRYANIIKTHHNNTTLKEQQVSRDRWQHNSCLPVFWRLPDERILQTSLTTQDVCVRESRGYRTEWGQWRTHWTQTGDVGYIQTTPHWYMTAHRQTDRHTSTGFPLSMKN